MRKYQSKIVVEATQLTVDNMDEVEAWCKGSIKGTKLPPDQRVIELQTLAGEMRAEVGDYIVKYPEGDFYILTEDKFNTIYDHRMI